MYNNSMRTPAGRMIIAALGCIIMSIGINMFTTPQHLYTTGLMGYAQLIRSFLEERMGIAFAGIDLAGVLYYVLSIPIILITFRTLGRAFFIRTFIFTLFFSATTAFIPVPVIPYIEDPLTSVVVGAICVGVGDGMVLTCGCSVGGIDMLGVYLSKKHGMSVGKVGTVANIALFVICFFIYDFSIVLYSVIFMVFTNLIVDKMHQQNINVQAMIFTKHTDNAIASKIMEETGRGVTRWDGYGAYTNEQSSVLCTCINRYEQEQIERIVKGIDPNAFIIMNYGVHINGNFQHRV